MSNENAWFGERENVAHKHLCKASLIISLVQKGKNNGIIDRDDVKFQNIEVQGSQLQAVFYVI